MPLHEIKYPRGGIVKIIGDYAIINTPEGAACLGFEVKYDAYGEFNHRALTRHRIGASITPKEGDAVFCYSPGQHGNKLPQYQIAGPNHFHNGKPCGGVVAANALTIGKTVGELRDLLEWCNEN